ncbi:MAG: hypothetical protein JO023_05440, partial [Chloroflexi bacterium]|nr:hypothetical protein [Chloroflexota bacterium]
PRPVLGTLYVAPRTPLEEKIAAIWGAVLGIDQIGVEDNFFELGGNSLLGIGLIAQLRRELQLDRLPAHILYEAPSVSLLAEQVQRPADESVLIEDRHDQNRDAKLRGKLAQLRRRARPEAS